MPVKKRIGRPPKVVTVTRELGHGVKLRTTTIDPIPRAPTPPKEQPKAPEPVSSWTRKQRKLWAEIDEAKKEMEAKKKVWDEILAKEEEEKAKLTSESKPEQKGEFTVSDTFKLSAVSFHVQWMAMTMATIAAINSLLGAYTYRWLVFLAAGMLGIVASRWFKL